MIKELRSQPSVDENDVNKVTDAICNILITSAGKTLKKRNNSCKITSMNTSNKPWFNKSCRTARRKFHLAKRIHFKEKSDNSRNVLKLSSKEYKKVMDKCIKDYNNNISDKLATIHKGNPKEYWDILNSCNKKNKSSIDINSMFEFMKKTNEIVDHDYECDNIDINLGDDSTLNQPITEDEI